MSERVPAAARALVKVAAWLVPAWRRPGWRRQWSAELEHLCARPGGSGLAIRFALGAVRHATWLRFEELRLRGSAIELRLAARGLVRRPGFTVLAVATLSIGIGASTAVFSLAEAMILRPVPFPEGDRLVRVFSADYERGLESFSVSWPDYEDWVLRSGLFESSAVYQELDRDVSGDGEPERVRVVAVGDGYFETLGSNVLIGRALDAGDHEAASPATVVISEAFWIRRFGGDGDAVGRTLRLDGAPHTIVGVLRHGQDWPAHGDVWAPLRWGGAPPSFARRRSNHMWQVVGRLAPGVGADQASARVREIARSIYAGDDIDERDVATEGYVVSLRAAGGGDTAVEILVTMGIAVSFVLLIACMNASGLLLTRAWDRARELSVRSALGAGRARLVGSLLAESTVLALLGGGAGILLGIAALRRGLRFASPEIASISDVQLNPWVVAAGLVLSLVAALVSGLLPALRATGGPLAEMLKEGSAQAGGGRSAARLRRGLVVGEIALSLTLLVGAGLTVRTLRAQLAADPGFDPDGLISFTMRLPPSRYGEVTLAERFWTEAVERLERHSAIRSATAVSMPPLGAPGTSLYRAFVLDGDPEPPDGTAHDALWVEIDPGFFTTLGVEPRTGRSFTTEDDASAPPVAILNRRMASRLAVEESVLGRQVISVYDERVPRIVVGIVDDLQFQGMSRAQRTPVVFVPRPQAARREMSFLVRTDVETGEVAPAIRATLAALDPDVAVDQLQTLRDAHAADLGGLRFVTALFAAFGVLALVLSVSGVYGLVSYAVTRRGREIGMRFAMGATASRVHRGLLADSVRLASIGLLIGAALAGLAARLVAAGLGDAAVVDIRTFVAVIALLLGAVVLATWLPAMRVARVDPASVLRAE